MLKLEIQKTTTLLIFIKISLNIQIDKFVYRSDLETTNVAFFPSKCLENTVYKINEQKLSTLTVSKFTTSEGVDIT